jgi:hypothetical protein
MRTLLAFTFAAGCVVPAARAADGETSSDDVLSQVTFGKNIYGPELKVEDLKGRVVLIEFWGQH